MGQASGVRRRKARSGNYNVLSKHKGGRRRDVKNMTKGLEIIGLEDGSGAQVLMTRLDKQGLVSNLKQFSKPNRRLLIDEKCGRVTQLNNKKKLKEDNKEPSKLVSNLMEQKDAKLQKIREMKEKYTNKSIPKPHIKIFTHYLDTYGEDYRAMVRDPMNYDQLTVSQIRKKIQMFKESGAPYADFLKDRGLLVADDDMEVSDDDSEDDDISVQEEDENSSGGETEVQKKSKKSIARDNKKRLQQKIEEMEENDQKLREKLTKIKSKPALYRERREMKVQEVGEKDDEPAAGTGSKKNHKLHLRRKKAKVAKKKAMVKAASRSMEEQ